MNRKISSVFYSLEAWIARETSNSGSSFFDCFFEIRIAAVKHLLGVFDEAVVLYKAILDEQPDYVPALKGD